MQRPGHLAHMWSHIWCLVTWMCPRVSLLPGQRRRCTQLFLSLLDVRTSCQAPLPPWLADDPGRAGTEWSVLCGLCCPSCVLISGHVAGEYGEVTGTGSRRVCFLFMRVSQHGSWAPVSEAKPSLKGECGLAV